MAFTKQASAFRKTHTTKTGGNTILWNSFWEILFPKNMKL